MARNLIRYVLQHITFSPKVLVVQVTIIPKNPLDDPLKIFSNVSFYNTNA